MAGPVIGSRDGLRVELPEARYMERKLDRLDRRIRTKLLRPAMRAAAAVIRKALRSAAKAHRASGDLAKSAAVAVRKARGGGFYAIVGFRYNKFGDRPGTPQDPGVYSQFVESGASRAQRGRVPATRFASKAITGAVLGAATRAFADKVRESLSLLEERD